MEYQRLEYCLSRDVLIVRFVLITQQAELAVRQVRDELVDLVLRVQPKSLAVDFEERHGWPAEILGCLSHAQRVMQSTNRVRCIGMPLQLKAACRFLRFGESVIQHYDSIKTAIRGAVNSSPIRAAKSHHTLDLPPAASLWSPTAMARSA